MIPALLTFGVPIVICVIARLANVTRWLSVLIAIVPALAFTTLFVTVGPILKLPSGERISTSNRVAFEVGVQLIVLILVALLVRKKPPTQSPQPTRPTGG